MAQFTAQLITHDDEFNRLVGRLLRSGPVPAVLLDDRAKQEGAAADVIVVDIRGDASSAMPVIERLRAASASAGIFAVASAADPEIILQAMRSGANEFFTWPP